MGLILSQYNDMTFSFAIHNIILSISEAIIDLKTEPLPFVLRLSIS